MKPISVSIPYEEYERLMSLDQQLQDVEKESPKRKVVRGLNGIQEMFGCSKTTAWRIKNQKWFRPAFVQVGKQIVIDVDIAWKLAQENRIDSMHLNCVGDGE